MKKLILTGLAIVMTLTASAQLFSPESLNGAVWGTFIGGLAGGNSHCGFSGDGAAIGAGVGLVAGAIAGEANRRNYYNSQPVVYAPAPTATIGYGYTSSPYVYYAPNAYCAPGYYYQTTPTYQSHQPARPNYALGGTLLGAASGALIGQGSSGKPGEGAAIGAGAGLVLGAIAEHAAQKREKKAITTVEYSPAPQPQAEEPQVEPPQQHEITSQPCPTSTYYWTAPPKQVPNAPRVPDAPTF